MIDGVDIREYDLKSFRNYVSIVMQEPLLFNMSIRDNIKYGNDSATDLEIRLAAK